MDTSSSEELTSDEDMDRIIESTWAKTKISWNESSSESENETTGRSKQNDSESEHESDEVALSSLFELDTNPSHGLSDSDKSKKQTSELDINDDLVNKSRDNDTDEVSDNGSSLFVVDKQPSLVNYVVPVSEENVGSKSKKKSPKKQNSLKKISPESKFDGQKRFELSSSLQVKWDPSNIYINLHSKYTPKPKHKTPIERISKESEKIMKKSVVTADFEKREAVPVSDEDTRKKKKERKKQRENSKGKGWYNMPKGELTEDTKNDLLALKMRRALDPKRFYKGDDIKGLPKYFQFGTVVEDASEFYSARIPKKQRKKSMVEELMADAEFRKYNKRKFAEVQDLKSKGLGPYQGMRTMKIKKKKK